jgi:predicted small integral membrane protein
MDLPIFDGAWWVAPIFPGSWMAWNKPTLALFIFIFCAIATMGVLERIRPGGAERVGILGLRTTRGDRLFISMLGSAFIFLGWLGLMGTPLWGALALAALWWAFVFWKV